VKIITRPTVTVVGTTRFHAHPQHRVPPTFTNDNARDTSNNAVSLGAFAAKGCYDSFEKDGNPGRSCEANQREVIQQRHGSVLEHVHVSVFVEGITRACSLELNRHRHLAISQRSTRYTEEDDAAIVLEPYYADLYNRLGGSGELSEKESSLILAHTIWAERALLEYKVEVNTLTQLNPLNLSGKDLRKWARGKARNILPHGLETRGTYTGSIRAWRWVIEARSSRYAEDEVRRLAHHLFMAISAVAPLYFEDYRTEMVRGIPEFTTECGKV
jgi:thymidylate synthase (FAD)